LNIFGVQTKPHLHLPHLWNFKKILNHLLIAAEFNFAMNKMSIFEWAAFFA